MPEPCKFPFLGSCQRRFLWANKEVDPAPHPVIGLMLQIGDTEKFPRTLVFESLFFFFFSESAGRVHVSQPYRRMEVTRALYSTAIINGPEEGEVQCLYPSTSQYRLSGSTPAYPNVG